LQAAARAAASVAGSLRLRWTVPFAAALVLWALLPLPAASQDESSLRNRIESGRERERALAGAVERLDRLIARTAREVSIIQGRLAEVEADLAAAETRLAATRARLADERERLARNRRRFAAGRRTLAAQLVASYKSDRPDAVSLVLAAHSFADLIERVEFIRRVQERNAIVVDRVRRWRDDARRQAALLAELEQQRQEHAAAVERRRDALTVMRDGLAQRQAALQRARDARAQALAGTRADRRRAERSLERLIAERERAASRAAAQGAPSGPWAIPWPIVQCESGGQNLPPNSAGASGYYQMMPATWRGLGGSTPHAYQAPKAEQDRLAATLWAGGAGARNWVCAELVGAI
jgi:septal ring factor EnvC (AmiA/AmiB activator)